MINIVTDTAKDDKYDSVAVNTFPIVFLAESLDELFEEDAFQNKVRECLKSETLYSKSKLCIRVMNEEDEIEDIELTTKDRVSYKQS